MSEEDNQKKPKIQRCSWSEENLRKAIELVKSGSSVRKAGIMYGIPPKTLRRRVETGIYSKFSKSANAPRLGQENENELVEYIKSLEATGYIHTRLEIRKIAYCFAKRKGLEDIFDKNTEIAGSYWLEGFLRRHPDIQLKENLKKMKKNEDGGDEDNDNDDADNNNDDSNDNDNDDTNDNDNDDVDDNDNDDANDNDNVDANDNDNVGAKDNDNDDEDNDGDDNDYSYTNNDDVSHYLKIGMNDSLPVFKFSSEPETAKKRCSIRSSEETGKYRLKIICAAYNCKT